MQKIKKQRLGNGGVTETQQRKFRRLVTVFLLLALFLVFFAPGAGVVSLVRKELLRQRAAEEIAKLEEQNRALQEDIRRFNEDTVFLERVAREDGFVKKGELIFDFGKPDKKR